MWVLFFSALLMADSADVALYSPSEWAVHLWKGLDVLGLETGGVLSLRYKGVPQTEKQDGNYF